MSERYFSVNRRFKLNSILFRELLYKHKLTHLDSEQRKRVKELLRDYCSEDLSETLIAINSMKRAAQ